MNRAIWPWKYLAKFTILRWHFTRNDKGGFTIVLNYHAWYTSIGRFYHE